MRDTCSRMNQSLDQRRTGLAATLDRAQTTLRPHLAEWRAQLRSLREPEKRQAVWRATWRAAWPLLLFAVGYAAAYLYGNSLPVPAPLWPLDAVLLAALLLTAPRRWWILLLVTFLIRMTPAFAPGIPVWLLLVNWLNDALKILLAAALVLRFAPRPLRFDTLRGMGIYMVCAVVAAPLLSATLGAAGRAALGEAYWPAWWTWLLGDALASLIVAPGIMLWASAGVSGLRGGSRWRASEALLLCAALFVVDTLVFGRATTTLHLADPLFYLPVPVLVWAAVRFGPRGIASAMTFVTVLAVTSVAGMKGLFTIQPTAPSVLSLQLFLIMTAAPLMLLAAQIQEHESIERALRASETRYRTVVRNLPHTAVLLFDEQLHHTFADGPELRMLGLMPEELEGRTVWGTFPSDLATALAPHYQAALSGQSGEPAELDVEHEQQIYHIQAVPMPAADSAAPAAPASPVQATAPAPGGMVVLQNVTEQWRVRDELAHERTLTALLGTLSQEFRTLAEHSPDVIVRLDAHGRALYVNPAGAKLLGRPAGHWIGKTVADLDLPGEIRARWAQRLRDVVATGAPATFDAEVRAPDDQAHALHVRFIPELAEDGAVQSVLAVATDVSALKHAEALLAEQANELATIFESQADGVGVYDLEGRFVRANAALRALLGLDADPDYPSLPFAERAQRLLLADEQGQPLPLAQWPQWRVLRGEILAGASAMETGVRTLDGRDLWLSITGAPLRGPEGQATGVVLIARDVTARRQLERQVAEQAGQLESIFEAQADGVAVFDLAGRCVRANTALRDLLGLDADAEHAARPLEEQGESLLLFDDHDQPLPREQWPLWRALRGEILAGASAMETGALTIDGRKLWISTTGAPLRAPDGQMTGVVLITRDVTARRALERQLAQHAAELEAIFEAQADGVVVYDREGHMVRANRARHAMWRAFAALDDRSADPTFAALPFAAQVERWQQAVQGQAYVLRDGEGHPIAPEQTPTARALRGETLTGASAVDERFDFAEGQVYMVSVSSAPIRDAAGQIVGAVSVSRDVTAQRQLERQVREQAAQLEAVFAAMTDAVFVVNADGHVARLNAAAHALFGPRPSDDLIQTAEGRAQSLDLRDADGRPLPLEQLPTQRVLRGEVLAGDTAVTLQVRTHDGRERTISLTGGPLRDAATGQILGAVGVARDVTELQRVQAALAGQERLFRTLVENSPDIITRFDRNLRHLYVSPASEAVTGIPVQARLHKTYAEIGLPEALYGPWEQALQAVFTTATPQVFETEFQADGGARRVSQVRYLPEFGADGSVESVLGVTSDITALKRAEEALRQSEERFSKAFHASPVPMAIVARASGNVLDANEAECELLGYPRDELLGHSIVELGLVDPTDFDAAGVAWGPSTHVQDLPLRVRTKAGEERFCLVSSEPVTLEGEACSITTTLDVTERQRAEEALRQSEERFSKAFHASPVPMAIVSRSTWRILDVNMAHSHLTGYSRSEMLGQTWADLGLLRPTHGDVPREVTRESGHIEVSVQLRTKSGEMRSCLWSTAFIQVGGEKCVIVSFRDVTERQRMEAELRAATAAAQAARREEERRRREVERRERIAESLRGVLAILNSKREVSKTLDYIARQAVHLLDSDAAAVYTTGLDGAHGTASRSPAGASTPGMPAKPATGTARGELALEAAVGLPALRAAPSGPLGKQGQRRVTDGAGGIRKAMEIRWPVVIRPDAAAESGDVAVPAEPDDPAASDGPVALEEREEQQGDGVGANARTTALLVTHEPLPAPYQVALAIPIVVHDRPYGGLLLLFATPHRFNAEEVALAMAYSDQIALAMANADLQAHIEREAVDRERNRLARELHDTVTQEIFTASVVAESLPTIWQHHRAEAEAHLRQLHQLTRGALAALRALLLELRPAVLEQTALPILLQQLGEAMTTRSGVPITVTIADDCAAVLETLPSDAKLAFYRIAQEALMNAAKYAQAQTITVRLRCQPATSGRGGGRGGVQLKIDDDGQGFAMGAVPPGHYGLGMMRERARAAGATLRITSRPGRGTRVAVQWAPASA